MGCAGRSATRLLHLLSHTPNEQEASSEEKAVNQVHLHLHVQPQGKLPQQLLGQQQLLEQVAGL